MSQIDNNLVSDYITYRQESNIHSNTIIKELDIMKMIFSIANYLHENNPFTNIKDKPLRIKTKPFFYSKEQLEQLFRYITPRFKPYFYYLLETGMRVSEMLYQYWDEYDFEKKRIYVVNKEGRSIVKMKSRTIPMSARAEEALRERERLRESETYVFSTRTGKIFERHILLYICS